MQADECFDATPEGVTGGMLVCRPPVVVAKRGPGHPLRIPRPLPVPRYLQLARHLKEPHFVALYILYRVAAGLRRLFTQSVGRLLAGLHSLLTLPKGDADQLANLAVSEDDEPFEPVLLVQSGQDLWPGGGGRLRVLNWGYARHALPKTSLPRTLVNKAASVSVYTGKHFIRGSGKNEIVGTIAEPR